MSTYICKCGQRVQKSSSADNTGNRLKGYGPGHECYGCPYAMPWGGNKWNETAKRFVQDIKGYECRMSRMLSYGSLFIGSTKDKCTCSVFSLDFDFLEQISAWVKDTFSQGELTGGFSRDKIRPTDYSHNGRYCCTFVCAANKKGISAKAALLARFFNPDGSRKDMTPQQEMERILADIKKAKEIFSCAPAQNADAAVTTAENAVPTATAATPTTSESGADASASTPATSLQNCESAPVVSAGGSSVSTAGAMKDKPMTFIPESMAPKFDYSGLSDQTVADLHLAEKEYRNGKKMAARGYIRMGEAVEIAHDALVANCDKHNNQHSEDNFRKWCLSIGITKDTAYRLLQISSMFESSSPRQQDILQELPPSLLYAAAKPSAPSELVEKVKNGEVTTNKAYQDLLKENQRLRTDRVEAMNQADRERARADAAETREEEARKAAHEYHEKYEEAAAMRATLLDQQGVYIADISGLKEQNAQLKERADSANAREEEAWKMQSKAEARAKNAEDALKKQPIVGVTDPEEVRRQADALAAEAKAQARRQIEDAQRRAREAEARYQKLQQDADGFLAPEQSCAQQAKIIADSMRSMYLGWFGLASTTGTPLARMAAPIYQVCDEIRESLEEDTTINPTAEGSVEDAEREALFE